MLQHRQSLSANVRLKTKNKGKKSRSGYRRGPKAMKMAMSPSAKYLLQTPTLFDQALRRRLVLRLELRLVLRLYVLVLRLYVDGY